MSRADAPLEAAAFRHDEYDDVEPRTESLLLCARIAHVVVKALNDSRGEPTLDFGLVSAGLVHAIEQIVENPMMITPETLHEMWMEDKISRGWVHGDEKDPVKKTHPCILPYAELPPEQRVKDAIVHAVTREFFGL